MNSEKSNKRVALAIGIILFLGVCSLFNSDDKEVKSTYVPSTYTPSTYTGSAYNGYTSYSNNDEEFEPNNPYSEGSGHSAGYNWAMENEPSTCGGNSQSFIEGCEEYMAELEESEE